MIVAFYSYQSEAGKDTCVDFAMDWAAAHGLPAARTAFAREMKLICARALGILFDREDELSLREAIRIIDQLKLDGTVSYDVTNLNETNSVGGRDFIIGLAEGVREHDRGFWTRIVLQQETDDLLFVSDLRFAAEHDAVEDREGVVVEVDRPGAPHYNEDALNTHYKITNDGSLEDLRLRVYAVMNEIKESYHAWG